MLKINKFESRNPWNLTSSFCRLKISVVVDLRHAERANRRAGGGHFWYKTSNSVRKLLSYMVL